MPRVVVAGNWKMNLDPEGARAFFRAFAPAEPHADVLVFPPALSLAAARDAAAPSVRLGVQNIYWEEAGAFTGELSAPMARAAGATYTLIGHSERRQLFGESDADVARKATAAARHALVPVVCVGETLAERRAGRVEEVILRQVDAALEGLGDVEFMLAYEPVWAIGTGVNATPQDAAEAHGTLRARLADRLGGRGREVSILYGGSVKPENAGDLMAAPDVDGVLVGGASLDPRSFARIVEAAPRR